VLAADAFDLWIQMCWWLMLLISEMCCVLMFLMHYSLDYANLICQLDLWLLTTVMA
jgi:hypothetical protein